MHPVSALRAAFAASCVASLLAAVAVAQTPRPAGPSSAPSSEKSGEKAVQAAIQALRKEFSASRDTTTLRAACNYFGDAPPQDLTPELIAATLAKPVGSSLTEQAYVKWQLLSAIPGKFPDELAAKVLKAYRAAPKAPTRPGTTPAARDALQGMLARAFAAEEVNRLAERFDNAVSRYEADCRPIIAYRAALLDRLSPTVDMLMAMIEDLEDRLETGADTDSLLHAFDAAVRAFAAEAKNCRFLPEIARRFRQALNHDAEYFTGIRVRGRHGRAHWESASTVERPKQVRQLADWMESQAAAKDDPEPPQPKHGKGNKE